MRQLAAGLFGIVAAAVVGGYVPSGVLLFGPDTMEMGRVLVDDGTASLSVAIADRHLDRVRGVGERALASGHGLLLVYDPPRSVRLTFARTCQPLDVAFIDPDGIVVRVRRDVRAGERNPLPSRGPVRSVLEVRAGDLDRLGIVAGSMVAIERSDQDGRRLRSLPLLFEACAR